MNNKKKENREMNTELWKYRKVELIKREDKLRNGKNERMKIDWF